MSIPGFHAELSLDETRKNYNSLASFRREGGEVQPQLFCPPGSNDCYQCWNEGGYSGCIVIHKPHPVLF